MASPPTSAAYRALADDVVDRRHAVGAPASLQPPETSAVPLLAIDAAAPKFHQPDEEGARGAGAFTKRAEHHRAATL